MIQETFNLISRVAKALGIGIYYVEKVEEWANVLFVRLKRPDSYVKRFCRFVSKKALLSLPDGDGEYWMFHSLIAKRIEVKVRFNARGCFTLFTDDGRIYALESFNGRLWRGFDWDGNLIPRGELQGYGFEKIPNEKFSIADVFNRKGRVKSEWERQNLWD